MTDQSGAFPEGLREAIRVVEMYRGDFAHHGCTDAGVERCSYCPAAPVENDNRCVRCKKADEILGRLRAALERPRPAPQPLESWHKHDCRGSAVDSKAHDPCFCVCGAVSNDRGKTWGSAGTGAAPPDSLIQAAEEAANVLARLATRVKWGGISNVSRSEEDHWRKLADDIRELVRGGAAQPPPDDCSPEYIDAIIAALNDAFSPVMPGAFDGSDSGRLVGALLKRGLRIYPVRGGAPQPPPSAPRCSKCNGAGWARGRELDDADDKTYADTMTKYTCDWCGGSGVPREETNHE